MVEYLIAQSRRAKSVLAELEDEKSPTYPDRNLFTYMTPSIIEFAEEDADYIADAFYNYEIPSHEWGWYEPEKDEFKKWWW